jgi:hypothetical protein
MLNRGFTLLDTAASLSLATGAYNQKPKVQVRANRVIGASRL